MSKIYDVFPSFASLNATTRHTSLRDLLPPSLQRIILLSYPVRPPAISRLSPPSSTPSSQSQTLYGKGPADIAFTLFCALGFTVLRALVMRYVLGTFVRWYLSRQFGRPEAGWRGKKERKRREHVVQRFAEQGWSFLYCTYSWSLGTVSAFSLQWGIGGCWEGAQRQSGEAEGVRCEQRRSPVSCRAPVQGSFMLSLFRTCGLLAGTVAGCGASDRSFPCFHLPISFHLPSYTL